MVWILQARPDGRHVHDAPKLFVHWGASALCDLFCLSCEIVCALQWFSWLLDWYLWLKLIIISCCYLLFPVNCSTEEQCSPTLFMHGRLSNIQLSVLLINRWLLCHVFTIILIFLGSTWVEDIGYSWSHTFFVCSWKSSTVLNWVVYWCHYHEISVKYVLNWVRNLCIGSLVCCWDQGLITKKICKT